MGAWTKSITARLQKTNLTATIVKPRFQVIEIGSYQDMSFRLFLPSVQLLMILQKNFVNQFLNQ
jgi:hypothetical protein